MICPICEGQKVVHRITDNGIELETCLTCKGTGSITQEKYDSLFIFERLENANITSNV